MESPNDVTDRVLRDAEEMVMLEWRARNSLDALLVKIPAGMRQRLLQRACAQYGVTTDQRSAADAVLEQLRRCNRPLGCEHDLPEDCIAAAVALAKDSSTNHKE